MTHVEGPILCDLERPILYDPWGHTTTYAPFFLKEILSIISFTLYDLPGFLYIFSFFFFFFFF